MEYVPRLDSLLSSGKEENGAQQNGRNIWGKKEKILNKFKIQK